MPGIRREQALPAGRQTSRPGKCSSLPLRTAGYRFINLKATLRLNPGKATDSSGSELEEDFMN